MGNRKVEITVGLFILIVICSVIFLCFKVTDTSSIRKGATYRVYAVFDNIGGLKARSPIKIGGVVVGRIAEVTLDSQTYKPYVAMDISQRYDRIPSSSTLSIKTSGLLGEQFIAIAMGIDRSVIDAIDALDSTLDGPADDARLADANTPAFFEEGLVIHNTVPAVVLEDLIGQFLYKEKSDSSSESATHKEEE